MGIKEELEFLSDQEVLDIHLMAVNHLMYYETAESSYSKETREREDARQKLNEVEEVMRERNLPTERKVFL